MECACGERMYVRNPNQLVFDYVEGSPEVRDLARYALANRPRPLVWACYGCGAWRPYGPKAEKYR